MAEGIGVAGARTQTSAAAVAGAEVGGTEFGGAEAARAGNEMDQAAAGDTVRVAMNGVTGRMGYNQHLVRSVLAINADGGVRLTDGRRVRLDPVLGGRNEGKLRDIAERHGIANWTSSLDEALDTITPGGSTQVGNTQAANTPTGGTTAGSYFGTSAARTSTPGASAAAAGTSTARTPAAGISAAGGNAAAGASAQAGA